MLERMWEKLGRGRCTMRRCIILDAGFMYVWVLDRDRKMGVGLDWVEMVCAVNMKSRDVDNEQRETGRVQG
jgi:hypothetical protein